jgi:hypothetical protein
MSANKFTRFAVAGGVGGEPPASAGMGNAISRALLKQGASVKVLARGSSATSDAANRLKEAGALIVPVDYKAHDSLVAALEGVDVVISALSGGGFPLQDELAKAAKEAGVKLFVPSEYGNDTDIIDESSWLFFKKQVHTGLEKLQLPYALYFTGPFSDWAPGVLGAKDGKITLVGKSEEPVSFTKIGDAADFIGYTLTHFSLDELNGARFRLEGSRSSFGELAKIYAETHPGTTIEHEDPSEALKRAVEAKDFLTWLKVEWNAGGGTTYSQGQTSSNHLYPGWKPTDVRDIVRAA